jgi:hypothetical protein
MAKKNPGYLIFEVQLLEANIPVWRIIEISKTATLKELACTILCAMGWEGNHLYQFKIGEKLYLSFQEDSTFLDFIPKENLKLAKDHKLKEFDWSIGDSFEFEYDMGDSWRHSITLKGLGGKNAFWGLPFCSSGSMACPPEDIGGVHVYNEIVDFVLHKKPIEVNPDLEEHFHDFDPFTTETIASPVFTMWVKSMMKAYSRPEG